MHTLARLRGQLVRMRTKSDSKAAEALDVADQALQLVDTLRGECAALEKRCITLEAQLGEREGNLRAFLDLLPAGVIVTDSAGMIIEANRAAAQLLGRSTPRLKQELLLHFFEDRAGFTKVIRSLSGGADPATVTMRVRPRERAPFDAEITMAPDPRTEERRWVWFLGRPAPSTTPHPEEH